MRRMCWLAMACLALACQVPTQVIPLHRQAGTKVFIDGREVPPDAESVEMRSDRPHVVYLQRPGHRSQQLVLEPRRTASGPRLEPREIRVSLEPILPTEQKIRIEAAE